MSLKFFLYFGSRTSFVSFLIFCLSDSSRNFFSAVFRSRFGPKVFMMGFFGVGVDFFGKIGLGLGLGLSRGGGDW